MLANGEIVRVCIFSLNQSVMFHRCERVMNMNWFSRMNEFSVFILAECPQEDVTCNEPFYSPLHSCIPSRAHWLLELDGCLYTFLEVLHHIDRVIITVKIKVINLYFPISERRSVIAPTDFSRDLHLIEMHSSQMLKMKKRQCIPPSITHP